MAAVKRSMIAARPQRQTWQLANVAKAASSGHKQHLVTEPVAP